MSHHSEPSTPLVSLPTVRRLYFYLIAFVSLVAGMAAIDGLLATLNQLWPDSQTLYSVGTGAVWRNSVARNGGLLLVAAPVFLIHWGYAQRRLTGEDERRAALRKLFLYAGSGVALGFALARGDELLAGIAFLATGGGLEQSAIWPDSWLHLAIMAVLGMALLFYLRTVLLADGDYGRETTRAGTVRRLYQAIVGLVGLLLLIFGSAQMVGAIYQLLINPVGLAITESWWRVAFSNGLALALLGALVARTNWVRWQAIVATNGREATAALRRLYLYMGVVISALAVLVPAANLLREVLLILLGSNTASPILLLDRLGTPISFMPAGLIGWVWHWRYLNGEAARYGESEEGAIIRRIYTYAVAATGLVLLWLGTVDVLGAGLDALLTPGALQSTAPIWVESLATGLSLLSVGAPIWALHWRAVQQIARRADGTGRAERESAPRKVYLYGVALVGALLILFDFSQVIYRLLLVALGEPGVAVFSTQTASEIARGVVSAALWALHVMAIRQDSRFVEKHGDAAEEIRDAPSVSVTQRRAQLETRIAQMERELAAARAELADLD